jgi:acetyltransferase-like isoleucine patch superfamily enzyme
MTTQTSFDMTGLSRAIRRRDCQYHLALYAEEAEVEIFDWAQPTTPLQVLRGKPAIGEWLHGMSSTAVQYEVRDAHVHADRVTYTEQCRYGDGSSVLFDCSAEVRRGQIIHAAVTLTHLSAEQAARTAGRETTTGVPDGRTHRRVTRRGPLRPRVSPGLPGSFLG